MASDQLVTAGHVLKAVMELERRGSRRVLPEWEKLEPDLTEYILENLTTLYHGLFAAGVSHSEARKLYRQAETLVLVSLMALRRAQRDLWGDGGEEPPTEPPTAPTSPTP